MRRDCHRNATSCADSTLMGAAAPGQQSVAARLLQFLEGGSLTETVVWETAEAEITTSVAWGDVDNDGDLDLAVTAHDDRNIGIFLNNGGAFAPAAGTALGGQQARGVIAFIWLRRVGLDRPLGRGGFRAAERPQNSTCQGSNRRE